MAGSRNWEKPTEAPWHRGWAWGAKRGPAYKPLQPTQTSQCRGQAWGAKREAYINPRSAHKPCSTEGRSMNWKNTSPVTEGRPGWGETSAHKPHNTEGELRGLREAHTSLHVAEARVRELRRDPHKPLPSKIHPSMQGRTGGQKH